MIVVLLVLAAVALFGGGQYLIIRNGPRWAAEAAARTPTRKATRP